MGGARYGSLGEPAASQPTWSDVTSMAPLSRPIAAFSTSLSFSMVACARLSHPSLQTLRPLRDARKTFVFTGGCEREARAHAFVRCVARPAGC